MKLKLNVKPENQFMQAAQIQVPDDHKFTLQVHQVQQRPPNEVPPIHDAIQIRAAEYWLKLGEADEALRELEKLPQTWNSPTAIKVRVCALDVLGERRGL
jgi:hypothetical protein